MFGKKLHKKALNNTGKSAPISSHRGFPAVVALWFAALLGLGSLIVPIILFETIATSSGIAAVVPAAAPPLGTTARLAIALVAAITGALVGIFIARKVAAAQRLGANDRSTMFAAQNGDTADQGQKRPISAREELGSEYLDEPIGGPADNKHNFGGGRRRSLAVTDDSGPSEFLETVPLPGGDVVFDALGEIPHEAQDYDHADDQDDDQVDDHDELADEAIEPNAYEMEPLDLGALDLTETADEPDPFAHLPVESIAEAVAVADQPAPLSPREELAAMTNRFANPMPGHNAPVEVQPDASTRYDAPAPSASVLPVGERALGELGMVELVERFALALQKQQAEQASRAEAPEEHAAAAPYNPFSANIADAEDIQPPVFRRSNPEPVAPEPLNLDRIAPEASPQPHAEPSFAQRAMGAVPSGMKPLGFADFDDDEDDDSFDDTDDFGLSLNVSSANFGKTAAETAQSAEFTNQAEIEETESDAEAEADEDLADDFSSLLAMKSSLGSNKEFVRVDADLDDPTPADPGVVFPGHSLGTADKKPSVAFPEPEPAPAPRAFDAPAGMQSQSRTSNSGETERALKEALEKLQRMSGAA